MMGIVVARASTPRPNITDQLIKAVDDAIEPLVHKRCKLSQGNPLVARQVRRRASKAETRDEVPRFGKLVAKIDQGRRQCF